MKYTYVPSEERVREAMQQDEPMLAAITFDGEQAILSPIDDSMEHPPDYKGIPWKDKRIERFYKDGFAVISEFLHSVGYLVGISIPKRYARHLNVLGDHTTY